MSGYRAVGLGSDFGRRVGKERRDTCGGAVEVFPAEDARKPCRHCLDDVGPEQDVLLPAHRPAPVPGPYSEVGPIFVCSEVCSSSPDLRPAPRPALGRR